MGIRRTGLIHWVENTNRLRSGMQGSAWLAGRITKLRWVQSMGMTREYPAIGVNAMGENSNKKKGHAEAWH